MIVGSRGSALALAQTRIVTDALGGDFELKVIKTAGDRSAKPIRELEDAAFVAAIERALRHGEIDLAVHSLKDLPTTPVEDLVVAAIPPRDDPRDALITRSRGGLADLPRGAVVGTSSPRRVVLLRAHRPDAVTREIRGNASMRRSSCRRLSCWRISSRCCSFFASSRADCSSFKRSLRSC